MIIGYCPQCKYDQQANELDCCTKCGTALIDPKEYTDGPLVKIAIAAIISALILAVYFYSR